MSDDFSHETGLASILTDFIFTLKIYLLLVFLIFFHLTEAILMKAKVIFQHGYYKAVKISRLSFLFKMKF